MKVQSEFIEAFKLYGVVFGFIFLFFLFGLFVGREGFVEANPHSEDRIVSETPVQNVKTQLDFYSALKDPISEQSPIGLVQAGSETVVPEEQTEENTSEAYTVQVAALTAEKDAQEILLRLRAKGYPAKMIIPSSGDQYYRVWVGRFEVTARALEMEKKLREDGFLTFLKKIN